MVIDTRKRLSRRILSVNRFLCVVVVLLSLLVLSYAVHRWFNHDEFEHIHSAWYVANGYMPYVDFFQNHHPLLWYSIAPFLNLFGYSAESVMLLRVVMVGLTMGIACLTFMIAQRVTSSMRAGLLSMLIVLSTVTFLEKSIEIRPDVPQVLLGLISVYFFVSFIQSGENRHMILAGLGASFSFLFLQKAIFLLVAYAIVLCYGLLRRIVAFKSILYLALSFSVPVALFLGYLLLAGAMEDYVLTNWLLNMRWLEVFSPLRYPSRSFATQNALFWLLSPVSVGFILLSRKTSIALKATASIGVVLLFSVALVNIPHRQYFMFTIPLLSVAMGCFLERTVVRMRLRSVWTLVLVLVILVQPLLFLAPKLRGSGLRDKQLEKVDFVIQDTTESDLVYDGNIMFNLFRHDLHYFWYSVGEHKGLHAYNLLTNGKYADYNICQLVDSKRPRFISDYALDITTCGLRARYDQTPYEGLYMLRELEGVEHPIWRDFGGVAALVGYDIEEVSGHGDHGVKVSLSWRALAKAGTDYTVFIHLVGPDDTILAQVDKLLQLDGRSTSTWKAGDQGMGVYELPLPADAPAEELTIFVGLYYWATGERLPVSDEYGHRLPNDAIVLTTDPQT